MNINSIVRPTSHPKSIIKAIICNDGLPFSKILSSDVISSIINQVPYRQRYGFYSPDITLWAFLSQVFDADHSLDAAVSRVIAFHLSQGREDIISSSTSAYSQARTKLSEEMIANLARQSAEQLEEAVPKNWLWRMLYHLKLVDGSTVSMPDTAENQVLYPQPDSQKKGVGFPIARLVAVISCVNGAVLDLALGPYSGKKTGEHALLRQIMDVFKEGDVALGDCYYASYFLMAALIKMGVNAIFPIHAARDCDFRTGKKLGKNDHIVEWIKPTKPEWMNQEEYDNTQSEISIREVSVTTTRDGYRQETRVLVTTFLDPVEVSKDDLNILYSCRWWIELDLRALKTTLQMDILRGQSPEMVRKEIWVHILAYNMIRKIMAQAALAHNTKPRELSFKGALNIIKSFRERGILSESNDKMYTTLLQAIARKIVGNRPNRQEPRVVKRRPKAFPRMQKARHLYRKMKSE
jgi:IS4 transposase